MDVGFEVEWLWSFSIAPAIGFGTSPNRCASRSLHMSSIQVPATKTCPSAPGRLAIEYGLLRRGNESSIHPSADKYRRFAHRTCRSLSNSLGRDYGPVGIGGRIDDDILRVRLVMAVPDHFSCEGETGMLARCDEDALAARIVDYILVSYPVRDGMMTSSPGLTRTCITLKMTCLPPTLMTHSEGL